MWQDAGDCSFLLIGYMRSLHYFFLLLDTAKKNYLKNLSVYLKNHPMVDNRLKGEIIRIGIIN